MTKRRRLIREAVEAALAARAPSAVRPDLWTIELIIGEDEHPARLAFPVDGTALARNGQIVIDPRRAGYRLVRDAAAATVTLSQDPDGAQEVHG